MSKLINEASIPQLLSEMTMQEKVDLLTGGSAFSSLEMPRYGIPSILYMDGATGVNMLQYICELISSAAVKNGKQAEETSVSTNESGSSLMEIIGYATGSMEIPEDMPESMKAGLYKIRETLAAIRPDGEEPGCFPPGMLLGATWEPETVYRVAEAVAREAESYGIDVLLGTPNTNIQRDPKNGRVFESFSEDPYLSSRMAPAMVRGVQDQGMAADVKHFAANNQETLRQGIDEHISQRALREIYLPGFEAAVKEGGVCTVMSAYNSINGTPCAHNHWLLTEVLKKEWGFEGQVVSDWGAVYDQVKALNAGNDLDMPGPRGKQKIHEALEKGELSMERVDDAVARMLRLILKTPKFNGRKHVKIDNEFSRNAAYQAAAEGITLLKNNGILPLAKGEPVALFGKLSERFMESGSGSAQVDTSKFTSLLTEVSRYSDHVLYGRTDKDTKAVIITAGARGQEGSDRPAMDFEEEERKMLVESIARAKEEGKKVIVLLNVAGPVELAGLIEDIDALVMLYFPGMEGARAAADILFGAVSPSGKLPLTFPRTYRDTPTAFNFPGEFGQVNYGEGIFVGYRYYDYKGIEPLFPFGFGMSYSAFRFSNAKASREVYRYDSGETLTVSIDVTNVGDREAKETVQLYVRDTEATLLKPEKELKGFAKVSLMPGETKTAVMVLGERSFASYDTQLGCWTVEPGAYELILGNSSRDISAVLSITVEGPNPYGCSVRSTLKEIAGNERAVEVLRQELGEEFSLDRLKSNVTYFGSTALRSYLETLYSSEPEKMKGMLERLDKRLMEL